MTIATLVIVGALLPVLFPLGLIVGLMVDTLRRKPGLRWTRTVLLIGLLVVFELAGLAVIFAIWLSAPFGYRMERPRIQRLAKWTMQWWAGRLLFVITLCMPIRIDLSHLSDDMLRGNAIVIGRHRSLLDAIVPAGVFGRLGHTVLYTLKEDLRWEPNIDLVGHIMGHRFVTRAPADLEAELRPIRELGGRLDDDTVAIIFPEGTFFTEERKARIVETLEHRDPEHVEAARAMRYLLPPRPAGTLALLDGAPEADVIVLGHVGFEPFGTIGRILGQIGTPHMVRLHGWRIPRSEIPDDPDGRIDWLFDTWTMLDQWIADQHEMISL